MVQCNRCLAPLRLHQGQPIRVCDRCGAIQPAPGPAPGGFGPGLGPAFGPGGSPPARGSSAALMVLLVGAVLAVLVAGFVWLVVARQSSVSSTGVPDNGGDPGPGSVLPGPGEVSSGVALWDDAPRVKEVILRQLGPGAGVTEVLIYKDYAFFEVEEGEQKIRYEMRGGALKRSSEGARPRSPRDKPGEAVIKVDDVDFTLVSAIVKEAKERTGASGQEHTHVRLARHLPFVAEPLWSVYLGQGNAEFNLQGKLVGGRTARGVELEKQIANYFADASPVREKLVRRFGAEVELIKLVLYSAYAMSDVRDPQQRDHVDSYTIRPSGMSPGSPMQNARLGWDRSAFRLDALDFALFPRIGADAKGRLRGEVTHIIVEKSEIRVYVRDERNSGYVSYHHDGRMKRVMD